MNTQPIKLYLSLLFCLTILSCSDFLDREPLDEISSENYFYSADDLAAYTINYYSFPTHEGWGLGTLNNDNNTDNQVSASINQNLYTKGYWIVPEKSPAWDFSRIRAFNYFFENVLPKWEQGEISGDPALVDHYIGEMYFLRAYEYFNKLQAFGDFPILAKTYADSREELIEASKRKPRNEVARFILQDLDQAISLMSNDVSGKNRLTKDAALLFKSRVALFEASFLTYHQGTPRVPGAPGWPGKDKAYNASFSIQVDAEISYFLDQCMEASKIIADKIALTSNSGRTNPTDSPSGWNPYFEMFSAVDMSPIPEVLFWRSYNASHILHSVGTYIYRGGNMGVTKGFVDGFLMKDGSPIYASKLYKGDATIMEAKTGRDERLQLFVVGEEDVKVLSASGNELFGYPDILQAGEHRDATGYRVRKCFSYDPTQAAAAGQISSYGSIVFRAAEAYLNYMEASYMKSGTIDATAAKYWADIRRRAGVDTDFNKTIRLTDLSKENDWGAYSAGKWVDATLFNIRKERRNELLSEGLRMMDLKRWRALDQVNNYIIEGFNLWDAAYDASFYKDDSGKSVFVYDGSSNSNVSSPALSKYLRPFQKLKDNNPVYDGLKWSKANYLEPIGFRDIQLASPDQSYENSVIYQNPYWPVEAGGALE